LGCPSHLEQGLGSNHNSHFQDFSLLDKIVCETASTAKAGQAGARLRELESLRYRLQQDIRQEVTNAYLRVKEAYNFLRTYKDARDRTLGKLELVRQGYLVQTADVEDVLETQVERRWRDVDYIFAKLSLIKAMTELNYACGASIYDFVKNTKRSEAR